MTTLAAGALGSRGTAEAVTCPQRAAVQGGPESMQSLTP